MLQSLNKGSEVLKELQKEMSLERAESIMDRVGEGVAAQRVRPLSFGLGVGGEYLTYAFVSQEIDEALMSKLSPEEEESIEAELAALQREAMPSVPVNVSPATIIACIAWLIGRSHNSKSLFICRLFLFINLLNKRRRKSRRRGRSRSSERKICGWL